MIFASDKCFCVRFSNKNVFRLSVFRGPAWEWSEVRGQYYYHAFTKYFVLVSFLSILALSMLHDSRFCFHASTEYLMFSLILSSFSQWPHIIQTPESSQTWTTGTLSLFKRWEIFCSFGRTGAFRYKQKIGHFHHMIYFLIANVVIKTLPGVLMASAWTPCLSSSKISSSETSHSREKQT